MFFGTQVIRGDLSRPQTLSFLFQAQMKAPSEWTASFARTAATMFVSRKTYLILNPDKSFLQLIIRGISDLFFHFSHPLSYL